MATLSANSHQGNPEKRVEYIRKYFGEENILLTHETPERAQ